MAGSTALTDLRAANESVAYLRGLGIEAVVEPITLRYRDLTATIGYELVLIVPDSESESADVGIRVAGEDNLGSEPPL